MAFRIRQSTLNTISIVLTLALTIALWVLATRFADGESAIVLEEPPDRLTHEVPSDVEFPHP